MKSKKWKEESNWINDDLILNWARIVYEARKAVKDQKIAQAWTFDSKIFIKINAEAKPQRINRLEDIRGAEKEWGDMPDWRLNWNLPNDTLCDKTERNYMTHRGSEKAASIMREKTRLYDITNQEVNRKTMCTLKKY